VAVATSPCCVCVMQDINRAQVLHWKEHPEEWERYLEENKRARGAPEQCQRLRRRNR
jgi:hypothetical protein